MDPMQFEERLAAEVPALRRYARALTRDPDRAEDLVQDSIERALVKRDLLGSTPKLRSWLFRMMRDLLVKHMRRSARQTWRWDGQEDEYWIRPSQVARVELIETLNAFSRLPAEYRKALLLVTVEGFSYRETAAILQVPVGTVLSRQARARQALPHGKKP